MKKTDLKTDGITVTAIQLIAFLIKFVEMQLKGLNPPPSMTWGAPGIGKSDIIRKVVAQAGIEIVDVRLAQREPVDMRGLPVPNSDRNTGPASFPSPRS